jgi:quinone-modifying oxidoreductase subunit QmoC
MDARMRIEPDIDFIEFVKADSGSDLSICMQCGTCTAVCDLSPEDNPFPRKEMIWASWGMSEKLMADENIWLCHQCGDCSISCPRDVRPADVMASTRNYAYRHFARPRFLGKWLQSPRYLPFLILIPVLIIAGIIALAGTLKIPEGPVDYSHFFPHGWLNGSFSVLVLILVVMMVGSVRKFYFGTRDSGLGTRGKEKVLRRIWDIFTQKDFRSCTINKYRYVGHFMVFGGFVMLLAVTLFAILATIFFEYPMPFLHPVKILGNLAGLSLAIGVVLLAINRLKNPSGSKAGQYTDWFFLVNMFLLAISGGIVELARFMDWVPWAYYLYFFHLVLVWLVILYLPYTKFAHVIYRTIAMLK